MPFGGLKTHTIEAEEGKYFGTRTWHDLGGAQESFPSNPALWLRGLLTGASLVLTFLLHFKNTLIFWAVNSFLCPFLSPQPLFAFTLSIYPLSELELRVGAAPRSIPQVQLFPAHRFSESTELQEIHWPCSKLPQKALTKLTALCPVCIRQFYLHTGCSEHKRNQLFFPAKISYLEFTETFPLISGNVWLLL